MPGLKLIAAVLVAAVIASAVPQHGDAGSARNCVTQLAPLQAGARDSVAVDLGCYDTWAEAISVATDGRVSLQANARPADATDDTLNAPRGAAARDASAQSTTVIGIDYTSTPYLGATKTWTSADGCYGGASFQSVMPSAWNNVIRSSLTFGGCSTSRHYDSATYSGSSIACSPNCASMGAMDQKTSSERWTP